jgi:hypothetical protein
MYHSTVFACYYALHLPVSWHFPFSVLNVLFNYVASCKDKVMPSVAVYQMVPNKIKVFSTDAVSESVGHS